MITTKREMVGKTYHFITRGDTDFTDQVQEVQTRTVRLKGRGWMPWEHIAKVRPVGEEVRVDGPSVERPDPLPKGTMATSALLPDGKWLVSVICDNLAQVAVAKQLLGVDIEQTLQEKRKLKRKNFQRAEVECRCCHESFRRIARKPGQWGYWCRKDMCQSTLKMVKKQPSLLDDLK